MDPTPPDAPRPPLAGVRVLDLTRLLPGGYCTLLLADLGATVVKVEDPAAGDAMRAIPPLVDGVGAAHRALNRGKRSVTVSLGSTEGRRVLLRLAERADVLVEGFRPGVLDGRGVGYDTLSRANPALVWCSLTGFGQTGPWRDRAGHDLNYVALAGLLSPGGDAPSRPGVPPIQTADMAGGLLAALAVVAALPSATASGRGRRIDLSMYDAALSLLSIHGAAALAGDARGAAGGILSGSHACYRLYRTGDGRMLSVGALEPKFWTRLCEEIGCADLAGDQFAPAERQEEIADRLSAVFETRTAAEWEASLGHLDVCVAPVLTPLEALASRQAAARGMVAREGGRPVGPAGATAMDGLPGDLAWGPAPSLGQHTRAVLAEAGFSDGEIERLREAGAV